MAHKLLQTQTLAAPASTMEFKTHSFNDQYDVYQFVFLNLHPETDSTYPDFKPSINAGSSYGVNTITTYIRMQRGDSSSAAVNYVDYDTAGGLTTGGVRLCEDTGNENEKHMSGFLTIYQPWSTDFQKHFYSETMNQNGGDQATLQKIGGYISTTSAVNAFQFYQTSGNIDTGTIKLYGIE
mgnify:CR=1 FL=1